MRWKDLKARLLAVGKVQLKGEAAGRYIARSAARSWCGGSGAVFFAIDRHRVKLALSPEAALRLSTMAAGLPICSLKDNVSPGACWSLGSTVLIRHISQ